MDNRLVMAERIVCKVTEVDAELARREAAGWVLVSVLSLRVNGGLLRDHRARELYFERRERRVSPAIEVLGR